MAPTLPGGIWAPTQAFFDEKTEDLDLTTIAQHAVRLARAGCAGIVTNGSNGESVYLSPAERALLTRTTRDALDAAGFQNVPVMTGASDQSVRGTLSLIAEARDSGASAVLLLTPSFFKWAMDSAAIEDYFLQVADKSVLPIFIYNYPAAVAGIDLDSELLTRLAQHANIVGTKFTCGNIGKLARVAASTDGMGYHCFSGVADAITPALTVGGSGAIVGAANVFPRMCVNVYRLFKEGRLEEARVAQQQLALADWALTKRAIPGFKSILRHYYSYGGQPRSPMRALSPEGEKELFHEIVGFMHTEQALSDATQPPNAS